MTRSSTTCAILIINGKMKSGEMLPSEWELVDLYGVSRLTVRRAVDELVRQNWLERKHGVGTFVCRPVTTSISASRLSFTEQMKAIGRNPGSRLFFKFSEIRQVTRIKVPEHIPLRWELLTPQRYPKEGVMLHAARAGGFSKQVQDEVLLAPTDKERFLGELAGHVQVTQEAPAGSG